MKCLAAIDRPSRLFVGLLLGLCVLAAHEARARSCSAATTAPPPGKQYLYVALEGEEGQPLTWDPHGGRVKALEDDKEVVAGHLPDCFITPVDVTKPVRLTAKATLHQKAIRDERTPSSFTRPETPLVVKLYRVKEDYWTPAGKLKNLMDLPAGSRAKLLRTFVADARELGTDLPAGAFTEFAAATGVREGFLAKAYLEFSLDATCDASCASEERLKDEPAAARAFILANKDAVREEEVRDDLLEMLAARGEANDVAGKYLANASKEAALPNANDATGWRKVENTFGSSFGLSSSNAKAAAMKIKSYKLELDLASSGECAPGEVKIGDKCVLPVAHQENVLCPKPGIMVGGQCVNPG